MIKIMSLFGTKLRLFVLHRMFGIDNIVRNLLGLSGGALFRKNRLDLKDVKQTPPKLLALCVAAGQEASIVEAFTDNLMATCVYPVSMFHLFLGVTASTIIAVIFGALLYAFVMIVFKGITPDEIAMLPKGKSLLKLIRRTGLIR